MLARWFAPARQEWGFSAMLKTAAVKALTARSRCAPQRRGVLRPQLCISKTSKAIPYTKIYFRAFQRRIRFNMN